MLKINLIGDKYNLILGEMGKIYEVVNGILNKKIGEDELLDNLLKKLGVTEKETEEVAVWLGEMLEQIKKAETISEELKLMKEELVKRPA